MMEVNVRLEIDEDRYHQVTNLSREIKQALDWEGTRVSNVSVLNENGHKLHGFSDAHCILYYQLNNNGELEPDHVELDEDNFAGEMGGNMEYFNDIIENSWLYCTCGEIQNASEDEAVAHLQENK
jgi:hypothetical protein